MSYQPSREEMTAMLRMVRQHAVGTHRRNRDFSVDDLESEGLYHMALALERYDPEKGSTAWTYCEPRVLGSMIDLVRETRKRRSVISEYLDDVDDRCLVKSDEEEIDAKIEIDLILAAIEEPRARRIVEMRASGLSFDKIAQIFDCHRETVRRQFNDAIRAVKSAKIEFQTDIS